MPVWLLSTVADCGMNMPFTQAPVLCWGIGEPHTLVEVVQACTPFGRSGLWLRSGASLGVAPVGSALPHLPLKASVVHKAGTM